MRLIIVSLALLVISNSSFSQAIFPNLMREIPVPTHAVAVDIDRDGYIDLFGFVGGVKVDEIYYERFIAVFNDGAGGVRETVIHDFDGRIESIGSANLDGRGSDELYANQSGVIYELELDERGTPSLGWSFELPPPEQRVGYKPDSGVDFFDRDGDGDEETMALFEAEIGLRDPDHRIGIFNFWRFNGINSFSPVKFIRVDDLTDISNLMWLPSENGVERLIYRDNHHEKWFMLVDPLSENARFEPVDLEAERMHLVESANEDPFVAVVSGERMRIGRFDGLEFIGGEALPAFDVGSDHRAGQFFLDWTGDGIDDHLGFWSGTIDRDEGEFVILPAIEHGRFDYGLRTLDEAPEPSNLDLPQIGRRFEVDLNQDGIIDRVETRGQGSHFHAYDIVVERGTETGEFVEIDRWEGFLLDRISVFDVNHDGYEDIVLLPLEFAAVYVYPGNGDGTFRDPIKNDLGSGNAFAFSNLNNDREPDLLFHSGGTDYEELPVIKAALNQGDGTFVNAGRYALIHPHEEEFYFPSAITPDFFRIVDANNDGLDDIWFGGDVNAVWINQLTPPSAVGRWECYE